MSPDQVRLLIGQIGLLLQIGGSALLATLFLLLRRHAAQRRGYFRAWGDAWIAVTLAVVAVAVRQFAARHLDIGSSLADLGLHVLFFAYIAGKLLYLAFLVVGTVAYARGVRRREVLRWAVPAALVGSAIAATTVSSVRDLMLWQAPLVVAALGYQAVELLRLPRSRRGLGSAATAVVFALIAALWLLYGSMLVLQRVPSIAPVAGGMLQYNAYVDLLLQVLLGFGMVVILMEDAKREADDAHAELAVAHDQLRRLSLYDSLTECLNRRAFAEGVGLDSARATFGTVAMLDVDNLKDVNDTLGHTAGDDLLRALVHVLRGSLRPSDRLYRWGGDEFLVIVPGARAEEIAPRIEETLRAHGRVQLGSDPGTEVPLLVSVGCAVYESAEELAAAIGRADARMYAQKSGRKLRRTDTPTSIPV